MSSSATAQATVQGSKLAHPKICIMYEQLVLLKRASLTAPKLQDLHDTGQQDDQEESQRGSDIDGVTEARDLKPDQ